MGTCNTKVLKVEFDFSDEQITKVKVEQDFWGDCPMQLMRVFEKSFPARMTIEDILKDKDGIVNYLLW
jgi:hypothetical protein